MRVDTHALRIAMVTTFYPPFNFGGDGIYVQRLARSLAARGHHVEIIHDTDGYRAMSGKSPEAADRDGGILIHRLGSKVPLLAGLAVQQLGRPVAHARKLKRLLARGFDVIHFHNVSLIGGPGVWKYGNGIKLHTAHEHWMVCPTHILWRDNREICTERHCLRCVLTYRRPPQLWRYGNLLERESRHVDRFLTLSQSAADNHKRFGFPAEMTVFPSFLPEVATLPAPAPPSLGARPYFLFVGRLEIIKGLQQVIPVFDETMPADLLIAGTGNYEGELRRLAAGRPNVRFLGLKSAEELRILYHGARASVTPSSCYEVFPLVVLEAFQQSTPIIARDLGPYPEIIRASGGGKLFTDAAGLRAALCSYLDDPALAAAHGRAGRAAFEENWQEGVVVRRYFDLIGQVAASKGLPALQERAMLASLAT